MIVGVAVVISGGGGGSGGALSVVHSLPSSQVWPGCAHGEWCCLLSIFVEDCKSVPDSKK